ncbi:hypothetical protein N8344_01180 [bacterium]|nr:hypothetical protein [bacterium]
MKLSQLIENFVISNDEFEDYLNRSTEQLMQELQSGKNPRDAVHELALTFADQHNKSYDAYTRMSDSLSARMHTLELGGSTSTEIAPADMTNGPDMSDMGDMGAPEMGGEPEMMTDPMGDMEMDVPAEDDMPGDSDMDDYSAVMDNKPEVEESYSQGDENEEGMVSNCCGAPIMDVYQGHGRCSDCKEMASAELEESVNESTKGCADCEWIKDETDGDIDTCDECAAEKRKTNEASDEDEKTIRRAFAKADGPERGEKPKKVSLKKAPWEESVNEGDDTVKVVFRKFDNGDVIALFPEEEQGRGLITSYMEIGQHGDASKSLITDLEPASKEEYAELAAELKRIGYDIVMAESVNEAKASILDQLQSIVDNKQAKSIKFDDGSSKVDMFTASAITQVYAKVNDDNKAKIEKMLNTRTGLMKIAKVAMGALKEGKLDEVLPAVGAIAGGVARIAGGVARAAVSKGIKGAATRAGIKSVAKSAFAGEAEEMANKIMSTSSRQSFSEYNEFYKELDKAAKSGKKKGDTISVGGTKIKLKSAPKPMDQLSDAEMDRIDALAIRLSEMDR